MLFLHWQAPQRYPGETGRMGFVPAPANSQPNFYLGDFSLPGISKHDQIAIRGGGSGKTLVQMRVEGGRVVAELVIGGDRRVRNENPLDAYPGGNVCLIAFGTQKNEQPFETVIKIDFKNHKLIDEGSFENGRRDDLVSRGTMFSYIAAPGHKYTQTQWIWSAAKESFVKAHSRLVRTIPRQAPTP